MAQKWTKEEDAVLDRIWADDQPHKYARAFAELNRPLGSIKSHVSERQSSGLMIKSAIIRKVREERVWPRYFDSAGLIERLHLTRRKAA